MGVPHFSPGKDVTRIAHVAIAAGQVVESLSGQPGKVQPSGDTSLRVKGVAKYAAAIGEKVVISRGKIENVLFSGAVEDGQRLVSMTLGRVKVAPATPDARALIGVAEQDVADGAYGAAYIDAV